MVKKLTKYFWKTVGFNKKRNGIEIIHDILRACIEPKRLTDMMRWGNVNPTYGKHKWLVQACEDNNWLIRTRDTWKTTQDGHAILAHIIQFEKLILGREPS